MSTLMFILALLFYPHAAQTAPDADEAAKPVVQRLQLGEWLYFSCDDGAINRLRPIEVPLALCLSGLGQKPGYGFRGQPLWNLDHLGII